MKTTCDICKVGTRDLGFDDVHGSMHSPTWMYAFMCRECRAVNDAFWELSVIQTRIKLAISNIGKVK